MKNRINTPSISNQSGFSPLELVIIILVVLAVGFTGWFVYIHEEHNKTSSLATTTTKKVATSQTSTKSTQAETTITTSPNITATSTSTCSASDLSIALGQLTGAGGSEGQNIILTNSSNTNCTTEGYPTVVLTDSNGNTLGQQATPDGSSPAKVTLAPNQQAFATVQYPIPGAGGGDPSLCSANSNYLKVTLPGTTGFLQATVNEQYCPNGFTVSVLQPGNGS